MSQARAMFQSQLRDAVRDVRGGPAPARVQPAPSPTVRKPVAIRLWLPLTPLWVLLAPFALVAAPLMLLAADLRGANPYRAAFAIGGALLALSGTEVDVDAPGALVRIRIL